MHTHQMTAEGLSIVDRRPSLRTDQPEVDFRRFADGAHIIVNA
jgi:hypothetical protein